MLTRGRNLCETVLQELGPELEGREDAYKLCYIRGPEDLPIGLAEKLG